MRSSPRYVLWAAVLVLAALTIGPVTTNAAGGRAAAQSTARQPNVIFILSDDLGWGDVGYHGSQIKTPTLDRLAKRGVELNRYYTYAVCSPTRAAILTGRSSIETGVDAPIASTNVLPMEATLLPQHLKKLGYQTVMIGKWHLGRVKTEHLPFRRGFDYFYGFTGGYIDHYTHLSSDGALDWQRNGVSVRETGYTTDLFTDDAIRQITSRNKRKPLFLYLAYDAPHNPLQAPEDAIRRYAHVEDPVKRNYAAMVDHFDSQLARVLATVEAEGMSEDTLIIWASDNGPQGNSGGNAGEMRGNKGTAFEGGMRVPAIAYWPGHLDGGRQLQSVVTVLDWFPTLIESAGGKVPRDKRIAGRNVMPVLRGGAQAPDTSMVMGNYTAAQAHSEAAYQWPWKLMRAPTSLVNRQQTPPAAPGAKTVMLFDVVADPNERNDVAAQHPELLKKLLAVLDAAPRAPRSLSEAAAGGAGNAGPVLQGVAVEKGEPIAEATARRSRGRAPRSTAP
jgi:arylsulfatase A-like enzyme